MKAVKIVLLSILSIFIAAYLAFLFILPYAVDLNKYSPQITKIIQENTGFQVEFEGLKIKTLWNLSAGAFIDKTDLKYSTGEKFAQIDGLEVNISLIPLLFKKIQIDKIGAEKILANIDEVKSKKQIANIDEHTFCLLPFAFCPKNIYAKKYRISFLSGANNYTLKGENLKVSDFVLNKKIKVKTDGNLILNGRKQIDYNISIFAKDLQQKNPQKIDVIKIFDDLYKYNLNAKINADLKIKGVHENTDIEGKIDVDKIFFTFGGKIYPPSNLKLDFKGDKAKVNASLHVDKTSKAIVTGFFKTGKNKYVDLKVISDKINIQDVLLITKAMSKPFGIKVLQNISANGFLKADFTVKSDFKKVQSSGYLKIQDASIINKLYNVSLKSLNADIDFSQDAMRINQANAMLNSQPILIEGTIDKNANADISVIADKLQLKGVLLALGQEKILKENDISGGVDINAYLKGRLDKTSPVINALVSNFNLKNKQTKTNITIQKAVITSDKDKGRAEITALKIVPDIKAVISAPNLNVGFDKKDLNIEKTYLYVNNIRTNLSGKVSDISTNPHLNPLKISIPNQISVPIEGYAGASIILKGDVNLSGDLYNPELKGQIDIPLIRIPTQLTVLKNTTVQIDKQVRIDCPYMKMADSLINFDAQAIGKNKDIIVQNLNFNADSINLNTLIPLFKGLSPNSDYNLTILSGQNNIKTFKTGSIISTDINSDISLKNNILYLDNLNSNAYLGNIKGGISYDLRHKKTTLDLKGRGLSSNSAITALMGRNDDINGILDIDCDISMSGFSKRELLKSLKGSTKFIISNGRMGILGKFEHLIYAQNVISNSVFKTSLNVIAKGIGVKNTGVYRYMRGTLTFSNGWVNILSIKTSGPSMSLYITGRYYLLDNTANLIMLGRISDDVVKILGPIGEFSMNKVISSIPKIGEITSSYASQYTTNPDYENTSEIPYLTPKTEFPTKEFKVVIDGDVEKQSSVKSFKWLSTPKVVQPQITQEIPVPKQTPEIPDFVKNLPDLKN